MPSLLQRVRRGSESGLFSSHHDGSIPTSPQRKKRLSVDVHGEANENGEPTSPTSRSRLKSIFGHRNSVSEQGVVIEGNGHEGKIESLKKKLTSPSTIFKGSNGNSVHHHETVRPITPPSPERRSGDTPITPVTTVNGNDEARLDRYSNPSPRSPTSHQFASPTLFPQNFSLSRTRSPEQPNPNGKRDSWTPSYPLVIPDDQYAEVAPDGQAPPSAIPVSPVSAVDENTHRRSGLFSGNGMDLHQDENLQNWPALQPASPIPVKAEGEGRSSDDLVRPGAKLTNGLWTPPSSAEALPVKLGPVSSRTSAAPLEPNNENLTPSEKNQNDTNKGTSSNDTSAVPIKSSPNNTAPRPSLSIHTSPAAPTHPSTGSPIATSYLSAALGTSSRPGSASNSPVTASGLRGASAARPNGPSRRTTHITSPPMPQPIKNLPTLAGWPGFNQASGSTTPGWGSLAKEGGPKTPGGFVFSSTPITPGANMTGFPFSAPQVPKNKPKGPMTEEEIRKMRRAMPVMLREPSFKPAQEEGGEVGESDEESEESETEVEGGVGGGDSDNQLEPDGEGQKKIKGKKNAKNATLKDRLTGKGKGKGVPAATMSALTEEAESPPATAGSSKSPTSSKQAKPFWALPTPQEKPQSTHGSWMQFQSNTPSQTPGPSRDAQASRTSSYQTTSGDSYFGSQPGSNFTITENSTPRASEFTLQLGTGPTAATAAAGTFGLGTVVEPTADGDRFVGRQEQNVASAAQDNDAEGDDDSDDDGSSREDDVSSQGHSSIATQSIPASPQQPAISSFKPDRPTVSKRPSLYTQVSQSMMNLTSPTTSRHDEEPEQNTTSSGLEKASARPGLETIRSRDAPPTKIDLPKPGFASTTNPNSVRTPGEWALPPPTPAAGFKGVFWGKNGISGKDKDGNLKGSGLKRRRSADDLTSSLPKYEPPLPGVYIPRPRDEEGREKLPGYWCAVHIEGNLARKMEFSQPGVQSRDRSWKKHYFILRGTALFVYKFDPHRFPIRSETVPIPTTSEVESDEHLHVHCPGDRRASISGPVTSASGIRRGSVDSSNSSTTAASAIAAAVQARRASMSNSIGGYEGRRTSVGPSPLSIGAASARPGSISSASGTTASGTTTASGSITNSALSSSPLTTTGPGLADKDPALFPLGHRRNSSATNPPTSGLTSSTSTQSTSIASHFQENRLVKIYTLQNAESGLAADYLKRKNVVRVRAEGEQFLLQTDSARDVVDWIEAFQAATNVSLDLDDRPMPKIITLPRRRRRRVGPGAVTGTTTEPASGTTVAGADPPTDDTPEGNAAAVRTAIQQNRNTMEALLQEDQSGRAETT